MKNANSTALGFRAHSGWAVGVALGGSLRSPEVIDRRRIALIEPGSPGGVQPYHAISDDLDHRGVDADIAQAAAIERSALAAVRAFADAIGGNNQKIAYCGIVLASGRALPSLEATLRSHAMVHAAEGELYRVAIARAAKNLGWRCIRVPERDLYKLAAQQLRIPEPKLKTRTIEMGQALGSPWSADEKCATLVAWLALAGFETP